MATADVTVRGGGIFGLATAWVCLRRGARVRLIETRAIGAGASGGIVGALAPHVPENWNPKKQFQLDSLLMAEAWWAGVAAASGHDPGYAQTGRLQPLAEPADVDRANTRANGAAQLWRGAAVWRVEQAANFAFCPVTASGLVIHDTLSARIHPAQACAALTVALATGGAEIVVGTDATDQGAVIHATGWEGLATLSTGFARPLGTGVKGQALLLAHDARTAPQIFASGVHIVPHADGTTAIGSTSERDFTGPDTTDAQLDRLLARAITACAALSGARVLARWAGVRPRARSRAPMLGHWPGRPGHYIANGGFKIGFGIAPKVAETLADLILDGHDTIPDGFRVEDNF